MINRTATVTNTPTRIAVVLESGEENGPEDMKRAQVRTVVDLGVDETITTTKWADLLLIRAIHLV